LPERQVRADEFSKYDYYIGLEHIESDTGRIIEYQKLRKAKLKSSKFPFDDSCILYGKLRPYLNKVALPEISGVCSTDILPLRPISTRVSREYLYYYMRSPSFVKTASGKSTGANLPRITPKSLLAIPIPLPPIETQRKIAEILQRADRLRSRREQANQLTHKIIEPVFLKMFGNPATNPRGWRCRKLVELAELRGGIQLSKERRPKDHPRPYLTIRNVYAGRLDLSDVRYIEVHDEELDRWVLKPGDLLVLEGGDRDDVGRTAVFRGELVNCVHQNHVFRVRVNRGLLVPEYLMHYLNSEFVKSQFFMMAKATTGINTINMTQLKSVEVLCPPIAIQKKFEQIMKRLDGVRSRQVQSTQEVTELLHSLMQKAFARQLVA